jgi:hypothetical protein
MELPLSKAFFHRMTMLVLLMEVMTESISFGPILTQQNTISQAIIEGVPEVADLESFAPMVGKTTRFFFLRGTTWFFFLR